MDPGPSRRRSCLASALVNSDGDIWRLPGPRGFVDEIARTLSGGQHVAAILPRYLAADADRSDALVVAVLERLEQAHRVQPWDSDGPLVEALARQMTYDDHPPVTVPDLISHPEAVGHIYVCLAGDLESRHRAQLPDFLRRLEAESRSVPVNERCSFVVIAERELLPTFAGNQRADVTLANCWFWNRCSRWDLAAHLASHSNADESNGVMREVRTETIIEIARWDFDLAVRLASSWSGDWEDLIPLCGGPVDIDIDVPRGSVVGVRPPESLLEAWEEGLVDGWHQSVMAAPGRRMAEVGALNRHLWVGQARVLLPWIEVKRDRLETRVRQRLGTERFQQAMKDFARDDFDAGADAVAEIGLLNAIIAARIGGSDPKLRDASRSLRDARNKLAHLRPLRPGPLQELVRSCAFLGG